LTQGLVRADVVEVAHPSVEQVLLTTDGASSPVLDVESKIEVHALVGPVVFGVGWASTHDSNSE
jgi:hypothetical protein